MRDRGADVLAGFTVAMVLIPQSLAYAELAGMPAHRGLYAGALPPLLAAGFASSPWLQTGPVALTCLLTFGALSTRATPGSDEYVALAALLALVVGAVRLLIGLGRGGGVTKLMTRPILRGFTAAAALLIVMSQLPSAVGASPTNEGVVARAVWTLGHIGKWEGASIVIAVATIGLIFGGRRIHALFPGVLVAGALALMWSVLNDYSGSVIGDVPTGFPGLELDLPWERVPGLLIPGVIIALVGFAEPAAIAQTFAEEEGVPWDADREFVSQGVANLAAGLSGAFPVGGSFSRSALNRLAGAKSRLAGGVTGVVVLLFLPIAGVLSPLPRAVLGATVIAAVATLLKPRPMLELGSLKTAPAVIGWGTFVATLALAPRVELGVLVGIGLHGLFVGVRRLRRDP